MNAAPRRCRNDTLPRRLQRGKRSGFRHGLTTTRRIVGIALFALLLAQSAAWLHAVDHAPTAAAATVGGDDHSAWGHPAASPACQLFDQLLTAQPSSPQRAALPSLPLADDAAAAPGERLGPRPALRAYEARGPPRA